MEQYILLSVQKSKCIAQSADELPTTKASLKKRPFSIPHRRREAKKVCAVSSRFDTEPCASSFLFLINTLDSIE